MTDNWDDSDDDWDADDDELDARLGLNKLSTNDAPVFDDEEDLAVKDKALQDKTRQSDLKKKGTALAAKKKAEQERLEEEELARKAMAMEAELEANMTAEELRALKRKQVEDADHELTDDLFGGIDSGPKRQAAAEAGDTVELNDLKDHLKHARKVAQAIKVSNENNLSRRCRLCLVTEALHYLHQEPNVCLPTHSRHYVYTGSRKDSLGDCLFERVH